MYDYDRLMISTALITNHDIQQLIVIPLLGVPNMLSRLLLQGEQKASLILKIIFRIKSSFWRPLIHRLTVIRKMIADMLKNL